jgi:integrase
MNRLSRQARGLVWSEIERFLQSDDDSLRYVRDRALVCVAYDTMCRRDELVSLLAEDLTFDDTDGSATVLIRRSKTDTAGEGATAYLSPLTVRHLKTWLERANITTGPMFYRLTRTSAGMHPLNAQSIAHIFKRIARWLGHSSDDIARTSGHSIRVGAAQDLLALNIDLASVMQAGRWKDTRMPMRYGEKVLARRGGMARAAKEQGRT